MVLPGIAAYGLDSRMCVVSACWVEISEIIIHVGNGLVLERCVFADSRKLIGLGQ